MQMTMCWVGPADPAPLWKPRQVPHLTGGGRALHDVPPGEPWTRAGACARRRQGEGAGLRRSVIGSIPAHEDLRFGTARRGDRLETFVASLEAVAAEAVGVVCCNFTGLAPHV